MKRKLCFLLLMLLPILAMAQQQRFSETFTNEKLENVLQTIKKKTGVKFVYNSPVVKNASRVTATSNDETVKAFLDRTYSFMDFTQPDFSMAGRKDKKLGGYFFAGFGPVDVYTQMVETNLKSFATAGFRDYKAHVAGDANVPGSIMEKPEDLKAADEMVDWLLA